MDKVIANHYYIRVSELNEKRDGSDFDFEPDFYYKDLIPVGDNFQITNEQDLFSAIEKVLFGGVGNQLKRHFFKREPHKYGYSYTGTVVYDEGSIIKSSDEDYNVTKTIDVEVSFFGEFSMEDIRKEVMFIS